jgi:hypothetical protein
MCFQNESLGRVSEETARNGEEVRSNEEQECKHQMRDP